MKNRLWPITLVAVVSAILGVAIGLMLGSHEPAVGLLPPANDPVATDAAGGAAGPPVVDPSPRHAAQFRRSTPAKTSVPAPTTERPAEGVEKPRSSVDSTQEPSQDLRQHAMGVKQVRRVQALLLACQHWAGAHEGQWPDRIEPLMAEVLGPDEPREPLPPGVTGEYVYLRPPAAMEGVAAGNFIVVYEDYDRWPHAAIAGYADGHIQVFVREEDLIEALARGSEKVHGQVPGPAVSPESQ